MTQEEMKKFLASLNKDNKGTISEGEMSFMKKMTPGQIDAKFITERTGAIVSEEELKRIKSFLPKIKR